jgi:mycothiol synthase
MPVAMRPFMGETDIQRMIALAHERPADQVHLVDLPYRLSSWALDSPENIGLWENDRDQLVAWAVLQTPFWMIDAVWRDDDLGSQVLAWVEERARQIAGKPNGHPMWFTPARDDHHNRIALLKDAGFRSLEHDPVNPWTQLYLAQPASAIPSVSLPDGFVIRPLGGESEVAAYVLLHRAAFGSESMTAAWRTRTLRQSGYDPDLDLVVIAPDGQLAAFCICWFTEHGPDGRPAGQVEPMGVHPEFRRLGLGRALICENLRRLQMRGAATIIVEPDDTPEATVAFYQSVGFAGDHTILVFRKDFNEEANI